MQPRFLLELSRPYWKVLACLAVLMLIAASLTLLIPWLAAQMLGSILTETRRTVPTWLGLLMLVLAVTTIVKIASSYLAGLTANKILAALRIKVYQHIQSLPIGFHDRHSQGDLLAILTYEVARLSSFLTGTLLAIPSQALVVIGALTLMFRIRPELAIAVALLIPGFYLALKLVERRLRTLAVAIQQAEASIVAVAEESLEMLPAIKAFTREDLETRRYANLVDRAAKLAIDESRVFAVLGPTIGLLSALGAVLLLNWAGGYIQSGAITPTGLFSFFLYAALLTRPIADLAHVYGQTQTALGTLARLQRVLEEEPEQCLGIIKQPPNKRASISFEGVKFAYPGRATTLEAIDLAIKPGEIVAITGPNGAGKSTLIHLLLRFYEPDAGVIRIGDRDIRTIGLPDLRRSIGIVSQHVLLFNGTIEENIAFGLQGATKAQVERAAETAQARQFIENLPEGYKTRIGDHGLRLSGGQRQRLALARALLKNPPILVLDEATSMFDRDGEIDFINTCQSALRDKTVIIVSHRPESLKIATRILRIRNGHVESDHQIRSGFQGQKP